LDNPDWNWERSLSDSANALFKFWASAFICCTEKSKLFNPSSKLAWISVYDFPACCAPVINPTNPFGPKVSSKEDRTLLFSFKIFSYPFSVSSANFIREEIFNSS